jgi:acyl-CoA reductase-like NAD-dependent aldehyde dehydrogenase
MLRTLLGRFRAKRVSSPPPETPTYLQKAPVLPKASVEQIWSSWRYEKPAPTSVNAAERVNQLKRISEYEQALRLALAEVKLEEQGGRIAGEHATVPWYYWEAATIYRMLKRYDEEAALIRRFARNYDIHFRVFSKRYRSRFGAHEAWAAKFLERLDKAKAAAAARSEGNND